MNKMLIHTNIFIYALNADFSDAVKILNSDDQLYTTSINISEFFSVANKLKIKYRIIWSFFESIKQYIEMILPSESIFQIFQSLLKKIKPTANLVYDIEIVSIMLANRITEIATFNQKDFEIVGEIKIRNQEVVSGNCNKNGRTK
jgi:predicted nucleic acid-binding protein